MNEEGVLYSSTSQSKIELATATHLYLQSNTGTKTLHCVLLSETFLESRTKLKGELLCNVIGERFVFVTCPQHCKIFKVLCSAWHFLKSWIFYFNWSSRIIFHLLTATFFKNSWAIFESEIPLPEYAWPLPTGANLQSVHQQSDHEKSFPSSHYTTLSPAFCYCAPLTRNKGRTRSVPQVNY